MTIDRTAWENIPDHTPGTRDEAATRIAHVLDNDPFVRMFSPEIRTTMVECFLRVLVFDRPYGVGSVVCGSHKDINIRTKQAMRAMPLGFVTDGFKEHMQELVAFALRPHPERDEWHRVI